MLKELFHPLVGLLHALKRLREKYQKSFTLVLTGPENGNAPFIRQKVVEMGMEDHVVFTGFIRMDELVCLYQNAFAMVFPTFFGPDNIPPLEAFALGCPVVASRVQGAPEQLGDGALLFDPADEEEIALCIEKLITAPQERNRLIENGYRRVKELGVDHYVSKLISVVNEFEKYRRCW